jgi:hypothetical protein
MDRENMVESVVENRNAHGHEPIQTNVRAVWKTGAVIVGVVIASYVLIFGMMRWFSAAEPGRAPGQAPKTDREYAELLPLQRLRIREDEVLSGYEWVNQSKGVARIPIERAMVIVAEAGVASINEPLRAESSATDQAASRSESAVSEPDAEVE